MVVKSELVKLGKILVCLIGLIRMKGLKKIRKVLKSIIKITLKTKNTLKRYSVLTNMAQCDVEIDMCSLGKVQKVEEQRKIETRSRNHCCRGKAISIKYYVCVCNLVYIHIQHAKHTCRIILTSVACLTVSYFSTLSHKRDDFF